MNIEQVSSASTSELVAFYNKNCECFGKKQVKKFADRVTAMLRVRQMIEDIEAEQAELDVSSVPSQLAICLGLAKPSAATDGMVCGAVTTKVVFAGESVHGYEQHGLTHCPHCGVHLSNGVGEHNQEVNDKKVKHAEFEYVCLACNTEFGPKIGGKTRTSSTAEDKREAMVASLKLDRRIMAYDVESDSLIGVWKNAYQMYRQNMDWMTSAQQDNLTGKLYSAAKLGNKARVIINGRAFELVNV